MTAVTMYVDKFEKEVIIDEDHPLAVAQRVKDARSAAKAAKAAKNDTKAEEPAA